MMMKKYAEMIDGCTEFHQWSKNMQKCRSSIFRRTCDPCRRDDVSAECLRDSNGLPASRVDCCPIWHTNCSFGCGATSNKSGRPPTMKSKLSMLAAAGALAASVAVSAPVQAQDTIKVGILHSLSGTMAISETTLKDVMLMLIEAAEREGRSSLASMLEAGGRRSRVRLAALCREGARAHLEVQRCRGDVRLLDVGVPEVGAAGLRGTELGSSSTRCSTRVRKAQRNVFYTGAAPNQQAIPAVDYLDGAGRRRALGARGDRLCLSAYHQQDPRAVPQAIRASRKKTS